MQLVSWNTQWCCGLDGQVVPQRIVDVVQSMGSCDVLCLQEIADNYPLLPGHPQDQLKQLQALLPDWQLFYGPAVTEFTGRGMQRFGNLIATRLPVLQVQHYALPYPADEDVRSMPRMCTQVLVQDPVLGPVRVLTTHLEYHSKRQRMAQARFLRRLNFEALSQTYWPPQVAEDGSPFQTKVHTPHAVLCGDFNFHAQTAEYEALGSRAGVIECLDAGWPEQVVGAHWQDAWCALNPQHPQPATFGVFDKTWEPNPVAIDLVWLSNSLVPQLKGMQVQSTTQASDHQPVRVELGRC